MISFLKTYGLDKDFKLNIEPNHTTMAGHSYEHDCVMASAYGFLGSIDSNTGDTSLGWDTDQFPMNLKVSNASNTITPRVRLCPTYHIVTVI